jgi:hypothetical protein
MEIICYKIIVFAPNNILSLIVTEIWKEAVFLLCWSGIKLISSQAIYGPIVPALDER